MVLVNYNNYIITVVLLHIFLSWCIFFRFDKYTIYILFEIICLLIINVFTVTFDQYKALLLNFFFTYWLQTYESKLNYIYIYIYILQIYFKLMIYKYIEHIKSLESQKSVLIQSIN